MNLLKTFLTILTLCVGGKPFLQAQSVGEEIARQVALNAFMEESHSKVSLSDLQVVGMRPFVQKQDTLMFMYQINKGFVLVANELRVTPILACNPEGGANLKSINPAAMMFLDSYIAEIAWIKNNPDTKPSDKVQAYWEHLLAESFQSIIGTEKGPLLSTKWGQESNYNTACPISGTAGRAVTGCTATAMAQLMRYYKHPARGNGDSWAAYNANTYTGNSVTLNTLYDWNSMPTGNLTAPNSNIANLMYHCGRTNNSTYRNGTVIEGATLATGPDTRNALNNNFYYQTTLVNRTIGNTIESATNWFNRVKTEIDNNRPVLYGGVGTDGGHMWVCDGYSSTIFSDKLRMNWGWNGDQQDGTFSVDNLLSYNNSQIIITAIPKKPDLRVNSNITVTPNPLEQNAGMSATVTIKNVSSDVPFWNSDIILALHDANDGFLDDIELKDNQSIAANSSVTLTFSKSNIIRNYGSYKLKLKYRLRNTTEWKAIGVNANYSNPVNVTIIGQDLRLNTAITVPTSIVETNGLSATVPVKNVGTKIFRGDLAFSLHNVNGDLLGDIEYKSNQSVATGANTTYTFSKSNLTSRAGTYKLYMKYKVENTTNWVTMGNPLDFTIIAPTLSVSPAALNVGNSASSTNLTFSTNGRNVTITPYDWLTASVSGTTITVNYPTNYGIARSAIITVSAGSTTKTISVNQASAPCNAPANLTCASKTKSTMSFTWSSLAVANNYTVSLQYLTNTWTYTASTNSISFTGGLVAGGTYKVQVKSNCANGTSAWSSQITVVLPTRSKNGQGTDNVDEIVKIAPNPVTDGFYNLHFWNDETQAMDIQIQVSDLTGKVLETRPEKAMTGNNEFKGQTRLSKGMYLIEITTPTEKFVKKLMVN
jgi:Peptidase C10 family/Secretion system C-terminal sorting domain/Spi protease inhibitor